MHIVFSIAFKLLTSDKGSRDIFFPKITPRINIKNIEIKKVECRKVFIPETSSTNYIYILCNITSK